MRFFRGTDRGDASAPPVSLEAALASLAQARGPELVPALENCVRAAQLSSDSAAPRVLCALYLLAASLEGPAKVPSTATFRFLALAAALVAHLELLQQTELRGELEVLRLQYLRLRGRLGASLYAPRDVQDVLAGRVASLAAIAVDPAQFSNMQRVFRELPRLALDAPTPEQAELISAATHLRSAG
jgi:hypothetical protein